MPNSGAIDRRGLTWIVFVHGCSHKDSLLIGGPINTCGSSSGPTNSSRFVANYPWNAGSDMCSRDKDISRPQHNVALAAGSVIPRSPAWLSDRQLAHVLSKSAEHTRQD
jgi:hypothetical protein